MLTEAEFKANVSSWLPWLTLRKYLVWD